MWSGCASIHKLDGNRRVIGLRSFFRRLVRMAPAA
jgi:hypothetical protein